MLRAALYERVSTQEQERHGLSLEEQSRTLRSYAKTHKMKVAGEYIDGGISARKRYTKRPELLRLLEDIKAGKIDIILFTKLDRWFRNVGDYYEVQKILDEYNISWQATEEDYETVTASGRFKVNIMLSVAQDEADRTSERIKFVMEGKRERNEACCGTVPIGYKIKDKHIVIDPEQEPYVRRVFQTYLETGSPGRVIDAVPELNLNYMKLRRMVTSTAYKGTYSGVEVEPYISESEWNQLQENLTHRTRKAKHGRVYLFSGLISCPVCGGAMVGSFCTCNGIEYYSYRCNRHSARLGCDCSLSFSELKIESYLLDHIEGKVISVTAQKAEPRTYGAERDKIKRKLSRLSELYVNDLIDLADYKKQYESLNEELLAIPPDEAKVSDSIKEYFFPQWQDMYQELTRENKQAFWRAVLDSISLNTDRTVRDFYLRKTTD